MTTEIPWDIFCDGYACEPWTKRFDLRNPFVRDGYQYATDARIAIRVPAPDLEDTLRGIPQEMITEMHWDHDVHGDWKPWPVRWPVVPGRTVECSRCHGRGKIRPLGNCLKCGATGWRSGVVCVTCNGEGVVYSAQCDYCDGKGDGELLDKQPICAANISGDYDDRIRRLPGPIEFVPPTDAESPILFRFASGEGIIQPICVLTLTGD